MAYSNGANGKVKAQLSQSAYFKGLRSFILYEDGSLKVAYECNGQLRETILHTACLEAFPERHRHTSIRGRVIAVFILCMSLASTSLLCFSGPTKNTWMAYLVIAVVMALNAGIYLLVRACYDGQTVIFRNNEGGENVILLGNVPNPADVAVFVEALSTAIDNYQSAPLTASATLTHRIQQLAALRAQGTLSEDEFAQAKRATIAEYPCR